MSRFIRLKKETNVTNHLLGWLHFDRLQSMTEEGDEL